MTVADVLGLVALLTKVVDFIRYTVAGHKNGMLTQVIAWVVGVVGVVIIAHTQWGAHLNLGTGLPLGKMGGGALVALGLAVSSSGGILNDFRSVFDNTNTAVIPPMVRGYFTAAQSIVDTAGQIAPGARADIAKALEGLKGSVVSDRLITAIHDDLEHLIPAHMQGTVGKVTDKILDEIDSYFLPADGHPGLAVTEAPPKTEPGPTTPPFAGAAILEAKANQGGDVPTATTTDPGTPAPANDPGADEPAPASTPASPEPGGPEPANPPSAPEPATAPSGDPASPPPATTGYSGADLSAASVS